MLGGAEEVVRRRRQVSPEFLPAAAAQLRGTPTSMSLQGHGRSQRPLRIREGVLLGGSLPRPPRLCLVSATFLPLFQFPSGSALGTVGSRCISTQTSVPFWGFPGGSEGKESTCNAGDPGSTPGLGRFPCRGAWQPTPVFLPGESHGRRSLVGYTVCGAAKSQSRLSP